MVSSTVPRFEDRCPPVWATECSRNVRNSSASCGSCARCSVRSAAGSLIDSSSLYIRSVPAQDDEIGQRTEPLGAVAEACQSRMRLVPKPGRLRLRGIQAEDAHI